MTGKELFAVMNKGKMPPRIPFIPTIYEHAARVIDRTPSQIANDEDLIVESQLASYENYQHDLISVGVDIYNVECEALGARVNYPDDEDLPSIKEILVKEKDDLGKLRIPDPEEDGRMPLYLKATARINEEVGDEVIVNGTVVGPFTLAAILRGFENFITDIVMNTEFALQLMDFAAEVSLRYATAFLKRGVGVAINESWISPPLLSPTLYKEHVFAREKEMIANIKDLGMENVALISGGDTTKIAPYMVKTGSSLLLADYDTDQEYYKKLCHENDIFLRASIASQVVEDGTTTDMREQVNDVINTCADYHKFIFGCGVVSYETTVERVLELKKMLVEMTPER